MNETDYQGEGTVQRMIFFSVFFSFFFFSKDDCHHVTELTDVNKSSEKLWHGQKTVTRADKQDNIGVS